jgi:hypothetical protein
MPPKWDGEHLEEKLGEAFNDFIEIIGLRRKLTYCGG